MASKGLFREIEQLEEEKKQKARKAAAERRNRSSKDFGTGDLLMRKPDERGKTVAELTALPIDAIGGIPMRMPEAAPPKEFAEAKQIAQKRQASKKPKTQDKTQAALGMLSKTGGGVGNIASGAMAGASFGPPGMIAGAALGAVKNLAAQRQKKRDLQAGAIRAQGAAAERMSDREQDALQSIIEGFRSALIF